EISVNESMARTDMDLILQSRAQQPAPQHPAAPRPQSARTNQNGGRQQGWAGAPANRGFQSLAGIQKDAGDNASAESQIVPSGMPVPGIAPDAATESVSITGNTSGVGMFGLSSDEIQQRMRESREQDTFGGGQQGGAGVKAGAQGGGGPGGGIG